MSIFLSRKAVTSRRREPIDSLIEELAVSLSFSSRPRKTWIGIPQELIEAIIDDLDPSIPFPDRRALSTCAVVARSFVQPSQKKLFSTVDLRAGHHNDLSMKFSTLLCSSPHVGTYVKHLMLPYPSHGAHHILSSIPNIETLSIYPRADATNRLDSGQRHNFDLRFIFGDTPILHDDSSAIKAFSTPSLRRLELRDLCFGDPPRLFDILGNSMGLKELILCNTHFSFNSPKVLPAPPCVALTTLELFGMRTNEVDDLLLSNNTFNVTRLRTLFSDRIHRRLLQTSAFFLQELTLVDQCESENPSHDMHILYPEALDHVLPTTSSLHTLHLRVHSICAAPAILRQLGNLANMRALKRLSIAAYDVRAFREQRLSWAELDVQLAEVGSELDEVRIFYNKSTTPPRLRRCLPLLDSMGVLRLEQATAAEQWRFRQLTY